MSDPYTNAPKSTPPHINDPRTQVNVANKSGMGTAAMVAAVFVVVGLLAYAFYSPGDTGTGVSQPAVTQPAAGTTGAAVDTAPVPAAPAATSDQPAPATNGADAIPADPNTGNSSNQDVGTTPAPGAATPVAPAN